MYEPRKAAFFLHFVCVETRLPFPECNTQGFYDVLQSTDTDLREEIHRYNTQASDDLQINVTTDFVHRLREDANRLLEKTHGNDI